MKYTRVVMSDGTLWATPDATNKDCAEAYRQLLARDWGDDKSVDIVRSIRRALEKHKIKMAAERDE